MNTMKYYIEKLSDDGSWRVYRDGQTFNSPGTARRLLNRLMDRYGEDRIRLVPCQEWFPGTEGTHFAGKLLQSPDRAMNAEIVTKLVEEIRAMSDDDERAHSMERDLHRDVLAAIRDGRCDDPAECARIALTTAHIDFERWCA